MISRVFRLFKRYAVRHSKIQRSGFVLRDIAGRRFGYIDRITVQGDRLHVEGWALSDLVGLADSDQTIEKVPNLRREDVPNDTGDTTPGFSLAMTASSKHTVFWAQIDGVRYVFEIPPLTLRDVRTMYSAQFGPFIRDGLRALPAALHWLIYRDALSVTQVNMVMGLSIVPSPEHLNSRLFAQEGDGIDRNSHRLYKEKISIIIPVYNALDVLTESLRRIVENTDIPWRLVLVEDCSSDVNVRPWLHGWLENLRADVREHVTLIENSTNLGFIRSVNTALRTVIPFGDHVVLLNSDAFVPDRWASRLIRPLLDRDNVATVTPMSNDAEIFNVPVICKRAKLLPGQGDDIDRVASTFSSDIDLADAPTGVGFCMAMSINFLRKLPELDTSFGRGYGEEVDWCQRTRSLGGHHLGLGSLFVEHHGGTSFGSSEKLKLIRKNNETISRRYPSYDEEVQRFVQCDPLATPRLALAVAWAGSSKTSTITVYLAHSMGGGAEHYLERRIASDLASGEPAIIVLRVGGLSRWQVELHSSYGVTRGETNKTNFVRKLLSILPARNIVYSCGVGDWDPFELPDVLLSFVQSPCDSIEVLFHDYFPLSPSYNLLGSDGIYHGLPIPEANIDPIHTVFRTDGTCVTLEDWHRSWGRLMDAANSIIVFSESSRNIIGRAYPNFTNKIICKPHSIFPGIANIERRGFPNHTQVIGVLGNIGHQKGAAVLRDLSQALAQNRKARLVVIGNVDSACPLAASAQIHGDYNIREISTLVERYGITCWLIPSIWPETFSYTTHEALATGLPVWSFDLGAQGEAVAAVAAQSGRGGTIPLTGGKADISTLLDRILEECGGDIP